jgi:hypothetical protein
MSPWVDVSDGRGEAAAAAAADDAREGAHVHVRHPQRPSFGDNAPTDYITVSAH